MSVPNNNSQERELELIFANALRFGDDGFAMIAPYGDKEMRMRVADPAAFRLAFPGATVSTDGYATVIQRVDKEAATLMADSFNSVSGKMKRFFRGANIYYGHPDMPGLEKVYPDKKTKGVVTRLEARDNFFAGQTIFNEEGETLLNGSTPLGLSGRWTALPTGELKDGKPVYKPRKFVSVGMVPEPNLPVEMLNSGPGYAIQSPTPERLVGIEVGQFDAITGALTKLGLEVANAANVTELVTGLGNLKGRYVENAADLANAAEVASQAQNRAAELGTALEAANAQLTEAGTKITTLETEVSRMRGAQDAVAHTEITRLKGDLANAQREQRGAYLTCAQRLGLISEAEKAAWENRLTLDLANESKALLALQPKYKTTSITEGQGSRQGELDTKREARRQLTAYAETLYEALPAADRKHRDAWTKVYAEAERQHPKLVDTINN